LDDNPRPTKRQRYQRSDDTSDEELLSTDDEGYYILEYSLEPSGSVYHPMDTTEASTAEADTKVEDWEDLKELFGRAADQYESACARSMASSTSYFFPLGDDVNEALPLLRGVIHECHRFLLLYEDPSTLFAEPNSRRSKSPEPVSISPSSQSKARKKWFVAYRAVVLVLTTAQQMQGVAYRVPRNPGHCPVPLWQLDCAGRIRRSPRRAKRPHNLLARRTRRIRDG
jgi:hypothetical protein